MADETELTADEQDNFGAQPETDAGAAGAAGYVANFEGDVINGVRYKMGDRIADDVDPGTIAYLVQNGRISGFADGDSNPQPSLGDSSDPAIPNATADVFASLTADQKAEAETLKADNTADQLRAIAKDEGVAVETDDNKTDLAAKIVAARANK